MALALQVSNELAPLFDTEVQEKLKEIYQAVPGSLMKHLEKKEIVKQVTFRQDFAANQIPMGTKKQVNFTDFERALRNTIHDSFVSNNVTELRAEDISAKITEKYKKEAPSRADPGKSIFCTVKFSELSQNKEGAYWTNVNAYVYIYIEEACEDNCFDTNQYLVSYNVEIKLKALTTDGHKVRALCELIDRDGPDVAIRYIKYNT